MTDPINYIPTFELVISERVAELLAQTTAQLGDVWVITDEDTIPYQDWYKARETKKP